MIDRRLILTLGGSQLICWGVTYYAIGGLAPSIGAEFGWAGTQVFSGFSIAWFVMGISAPAIGILIDRYGGRFVMAGGSALTIVGCIGLSSSHSFPMYLAGWVCLGISMRATLYDAAFATLARLDGPAAKAAMSQVTFWGGLASTVFWPISRYLEPRLTWRGTLLVYAAIAAFTIPLYLTVPSHSREAPHTRTFGLESLAHVSVGERLSKVPCGFYSAIVTLATTVSVGISTHLIGILHDMGLRHATLIASFLGVGQSSARLADAMFDRHVDPLTLNLIATVITAAAFAVGLSGGASIASAAVFAFCYGIGNGLSTITRGTVPLMLFEPDMYGRTVGILQVPAFALGAVSPLAYAAALGYSGSAAALTLSLVLASLMVVFSAALIIQLRGHTSVGPAIDRSR